MIFEKMLNTQPEMVVIHVTDTYFIEESKINSTVDIPGFARFSSLANLIKSNPIIQNNKIPLFVLHGGDFLFPSLMSVYFKGKQMVEILNACGFNHCLIGNHDFDEGIETLKTRMKEATFDILCTNIKPSQQDNSLKFLDYIICQNKNDQPFTAIIGIAGSTTVKNAKLHGFNTFPLKSSLKNAIDSIRKIHPEINHLIVLSHMSNKEDMDLKLWLDKNWDGYLYLLGGHDHNEILQYDEKNPKSILVKGQSNCRTVQILGLGGSKYSKIDQFTKNIIVLDSNKLSKIKPDKQIQNLVTKWELSLEKHLKETRSNVTVKKFKKGTILDATELQLRKGSTNFGNFVADCMLEFTKSDIVFINSGHFRGDRKIGDTLRLSDLRRIFVLDTRDALVKLSMTSLECVKFLKHAYSEEGQGKILQVSKNTISILKKSNYDKKFSVVMLWNMLNTNDDGFMTILAKSRKTTPKKLELKLKKYIIPKSSLFDTIRNSAKSVQLDPQTRISVTTFAEIF